MVCRWSGTLFTHTISTSASKHYSPYLEAKIKPTRHSPSVVTSDSSKVHKQVECGRGKTVVICILACSLSFHTITCTQYFYKWKYLPNEEGHIGMAQNMNMREERNDRLMAVHTSVEP